MALFSYPAGHREPAGTVRAYLIHGEVGFWSPMWAGAISQRLAAGPPAVAGLTEPFVLRPDGTFGQLVALGYGHADVAGWCCGPTAGAGHGRDRGGRLAWQRPAAVGLPRAVKRAAVP